MFRPWQRLQAGLGKGGFPRAALGDFPSLALSPPQTIRQLENNIEKMQVKINTAQKTYMLYTKMVALLKDVRGLIGGGLGSESKEGVDGGRFL